MGSCNGREKKKKPSSKFLSIFKGCCSGGHDDYWEEGENRIWPSDEDRGRWVGEPGIDRKASAFIAKFHETRVSDPDQYAI